MVRYHTTDVFGETLIAPAVEAMREVLETLDYAEEADFPDVSLVHENGWAITIDADWRAILESVDEDGPARWRQLKDADDALKLWEVFAEGGLAAVKQFSWHSESGEDLG